MNPDFSKTPREELEVRLTALLLGELPATEAAALREAIGQDRELAALHDRLKQTLDLVRESAAQPVEQTATPPAPLKLSDDRRQKLLAQFKTIQPKEFVREKRRVRFTLLELAAVLAIAATLAGLTLPMFRGSWTKARTTAQANAVINNLRQIDAAKQQWALENNKSGNDVPTEDDIKKYLGRGDATGLPPSLAGEKYVVGKVDEPVVAEMELAQAKKSLDGFGDAKSKTLGAAPGQKVRLSVDGEISIVPAQMASASRSTEERGEPKLKAPAYAETPAPVTPPASSAYSRSATTRIVLPAGNEVTMAPGAPAPISVDDLGATSTRSFDLGAPMPQFKPDANGIATTSGSLGYSLQTPPPADEGFQTGLRRTTPRASTSPTFNGDATSLSDNLSVAGNTFGPGVEQQLAMNDERSKSAIRNGGGFGSGGGGGSEGQGGTSAAAAPSAPIGGISRMAIVPSAGNKAPMSDAKNLSDVDKSEPQLGTDVHGSGRVAGQAGEVPLLADVPITGQLKRSYEKREPSQTVAGGGTLALNESEALAKDSVAGLRYLHTNNSTVPTPGAQMANAGFFAPNSVSDKQVLDAQPLAGPAEVAAKIHANASEVRTDLESLTPRMKTGSPKDQANAQPARAPRSTIVPPPTVAPATTGAPVHTMTIATVSADDAGMLMLSGKSTKVDQSGRTLPDVKTVGEVSEVKKPEVDTFRAGAKEVAPAQYQLRLVPDQTDAALPKPVVPPPVPQPEMLTRENAVSTFSLNVSDVSFKLAAASLEQGQMPDPAGIRSEEFINAFDYRDAEPAPGAPMAFAWERARDPFAQNRDFLRFSLKTAAAGRQPGRPLNLVLLLDNSGSMERADRVKIIHEALKVLAAQLQPQDTFSVVTFARTPRLWVDGLAGNQAGDVTEGLSKITPEGGTNLEEAMNLAYATAQKHYLANGMNRVVLLTDGAANLGNVAPEALKQKVEAQRQQGIALDCFGIGWEGYNDDLLEVLSRNGDGRYGFINSPDAASTEFAAQLAGALKVAASDVKVQVEFNPKRVTSYRQIGYAKHQLTKEQFRDNTVDAAEIAAAESGNALYTVEVNPAGEGPVATVRVRFKVPGTTDYREQEWTVPFTANAAALEQAGPALRLAATASAFSEWLAASPYAGEVTPDQLLRCLNGVPQVYGADTRPAKLEWMIRQAKSVSGK